MKIWIVISLIMGLLVVGSLVTAKILQTTEEANEGTTIDSGSYGNSCTSERNCGSSTCGVVKGTGGCGC